MNRHHTSGNALIFVLIIGLGFLAVIGLYTATTQNNVRVAGERTVRAQMTIENQLVAPSKMREMLTTLLLQEAPRPDCGNPQVFLEDENTCGKPNPDPRGGDTYLPSGALPTLPNGNDLNITEIPFSMVYNAQSVEENTQARVLSGTIIQRQDIPENFAIVANNLIVPDEARVFDGNVVVLGTPSLPANENIIFEEGLITRAETINIGSKNVNVADFGPNIFFPCEPTTPGCPSFGGLNMLQRSLKESVPAEDAIRDLSAKASNAGFASRRMPPGTNTVFIGLSAGRTALLFCGVNDCMAVRASGVTNPDTATEGEAFDVLNTRIPRPPEDGTPYVIPSAGWNAGAIAQGTDWTGKGNIRVRSLVPNGAAYTDTMTLYTSGNFTLETSLLAAVPVCDSYPTVGDGGTVIPANCQNTTQKLALGLVAAGNIYIGNPNQALLTGQNSITVNAHLGAGDTIRVSDNRLSRNLVVGSLSANTVDLNNLQLTEDPRLIRTRALHQGELSPSEQTVRYARGSAPVIRD